MLHLADGFVVRDLAQPRETPVLVHARMQEILVHRSQLVGEHRVETPDDRLVALHVNLLKSNSRGKLFRGAALVKAYVCK